MKFNKSFLFATIIASSIALTDCNDKEPKQAEKTAVETTQSAVEKAQPTTEATQSATTQSEQQAQIKIDELVAKANAEFQKVANIKVTNVSVTDDLKSFSITYEITNLSDKAISEAQWLTIYKENNQPFYVANLPALQFGKTIAPKANEVVTLSTNEETVLSQIRPHLQQGKSIQVDIIGTSIHFADGSKVGLVSEQK
ncbi:hypothetical protein [Haemophilus haemolyticus]|uniref:Uncharacterized protein n=1 Tax=Haemophilus haemolyticus TaxID=726 RepID=A0A852Q6L7_HAEHA|nr:hypothetical protein [Haemophilus haemolyticus]NYA28185.1 hypothetical protein [Haemophilus haemolyticus]